jgi:hypothetical protein
MTIEASKLMELEAQCSDKTLPFPDNVLKELREAKGRIAQLEAELAVFQVGRRSR